VQDTAGVDLPLEIEVGRDGSALDLSDSGLQHLLRAGALLEQEDTPPLVVGLILQDVLSSRT